MSLETELQARKGEVPVGSLVRAMVKLGFAVMHLRSLPTATNAGLLSAWSHVDEGPIHGEPCTTMTEAYESLLKVLDGFDPDDRGNTFIRGTATIIQSQADAPLYTAWLRIGRYKLKEQIP